MSSLLQNAMFIELVWLVGASLAFVLASWMAVSTRNDRQELRAHIQTYLGVAVPQAYHVQADGNFRAEVWRVAETFGILMAALWFAFFHGTIRAGQFWMLWDEEKPLLTLVLYVTFCKLGAGWTARWHRDKAAKLDGRDSMGSAHTRLR